MGAQHTPGPWAFSEVRYRRDAMDWLNVTSGERKKLVATVLAPSFHDDADARLIAAAPELLEALEELADLMEEILEGNYTPDSFTTQPARGAIAKARGDA